MNDDYTDDYEVYSEGICYMSVCTSMPIKKLLERINIEHPTGIDSQWDLSEDKTFKSGQPNPCPCERNPKTHKHYLLNC